MKKIKIKEIKAELILIPSKLPGADWVINPYVGCSFGCQYCYAVFIGRWKHPGEKWGSFVDVKINAHELLEKKLNSLKKRKKSKDFGKIFFSSVTDPYLGLEAKYKITWKCLQVLVDFGYQGNVSILTKSPLVTRDIDLFKKLKRITVGLTVTTLQDRVVRFLEGNAPPASARIKALKKLNDNNISTYAFVGPLLPYFTARKEKLNQLFSELKKVGVKEIWLEHINLNPKIKNRLFKYLKKEAPELIPEFQKADTQEYRNKLEKIVKEALKGKGFKIALDKIIYHKKLK